VARRRCEMELGNAEEDVGITATGAVWPEGDVRWSWVMLKRMLESLLPAAAKKRASRLFCLISGMHQPQSAGLSLHHPARESGQAARWAFRVVVSMEGQRESLKVWRGIQRELG